MIKFLNKMSYKQSGAALLIFVILFMFISVALSFVIGRGVLGALYEYSLLSRSKQAYYAAEALVEDVAYRNIEALNVGSVEANTLFGVAVVATTTIDSVNGLWTISSVGDDNNAVRHSEAILAEGTGASFNFGLQSGNGGILLTNSAQVVGNVFSNGDIIGDKTGSGAYIRGDVISAGPTGYIEEVHATGSVWAHEIHDIVADGDAHYTLESAASVVFGTRYTPSLDQATATMPIPDSTIAEWQNDITASGTIITSTSTQCLSGTYTIDTDTTLGNVRIDCNVIVSKNSTELTLDGPIWIVGNLNLDQGPTIRADSSLGSKAVQIIVDNPLNRATSSKISVNQSTDFFGTGVPKSYVMLLSMNEDAENGGSGKAIDLNQSANGDVLVYASHGRVSLGNNISLKEVTAYQIDIGNGAEVIYESGLVNLLFTSGPGGGFTISDWGEI